MWYAVPNMKPRVSINCKFRLSVNKDASVSVLLISDLLLPGAPFYTYLFTEELNGIKTPEASNSNSHSHSLLTVNKNARFRPLKMQVSIPEYVIPGINSPGCTTTRAPIVCNVRSTIVNLNKILICKD